MSEVYEFVTAGRNQIFAAAEQRLRSFLPLDAPLKLTLYFNAAHHTIGAAGTWLVRTRIHLEGHEPMDFAPEPLGVFPSDELIASAMLVAA